MGRQGMRTPTVHPWQPNLAPAPVGSARLSLGQGIKAMLFRWGHWQWGWQQERNAS